MKLVILVIEIGSFRRKKTCNSQILKPYLFPTQQCRNIFFEQQDILKYLHSQRQKSKSGNPWYVMGYRPPKK